MRLTFALVVVIICSCAGSAQNSNAVNVQLSLADAKAKYRSGESIVLELAFTASEPGFHIDTVTTELASPVDTIELSPTTGAYPWLDDYSRGHRYSPDYGTSNELTPGQPVTVKLPLNALYRFDNPGHYTVRIVTHRVSSGDLMHSKPIAVLTSNEVSFDMIAMSDADEANEAANLESLIRSAPDLRTAQRYALQLQWLAGDPSTRVKLSLFLHPKIFYPFGVNVTWGLWVARNRAMVVSYLEQAMTDPQEPINEILRLAVALKSRLVSPYVPSVPAQQFSSKQIEEEYLHRIAASLPQRHGDSLTSTAITLLTTLAGRNETKTPEFEAAREAIITHFTDVNEYKVDWVLNSFGKYLTDYRMVSQLEKMLQTTKFSSVRAPMLRQLIELAPEESKPFVVDQICDPKTIVPFDIFDAAPFDSLLDADSCLREQIHHLVTGSTRQQIYLQNKAALLSRFATAAIYDDLLVLYMESGKDWSGQVRGSMIAYFVRYDEKRGRSLLEAALPADSEQPDLNVTFTLSHAYYSRGLDRFFRSRLDSLILAQSGMALYEMSRHGPLEDQQLIRERLERWRAQWSKSAESIPQQQAGLETELIQAVIHGQNWQLPEAEAAVLRGSCLSDPCRKRFEAKH